MQERCEYCDGGQVDGDPIPTPDGPWYPTLTCRACNGDGWVVIEYTPLAEMSAAEREAALDEMGEAEDSLMLGGCGGGERDPDLEWY